MSNVNDQQEYIEPELIEEDSEHKISKASDVVTILDRFQVYLDSPLKRFSSLTSKAYKAIDKEDPSNLLFALIPEEGINPRINISKKFMGKGLNGTLKLIAYSSEVVKSEGRSATFFIYKKPLGPALADIYKSLLPRELPNNIIRPILTTLRLLEQQAISHRNIRVNNIYFADKEQTELVLGDCITSMPGASQPVVYETIERAMADKHGRGTGNASDDIYALGVMIVHILEGAQPLHGYSKYDLLKMKIEEGSYSSLSPAQISEPRLIDFLRGCLSDDASIRWTIEDAENWVESARVTPPQQEKTPRPTRPFEFNGKSFTNTRQIAEELGQNPGKVQELVDGSIYHWVMKDLKDVESAVMISNIIDDPIRSSNVFMFSSYMCMALDPYGPIRYKTLNIMIDSLGYTLSYYVINSLPLIDFSELILRNIAKDWLERQMLGPLTTLYGKLIQKLGKILRDKRIGGGIERCLYELAPGLNCLSPLLKDEYVTDIRGLLPALNRVAPYVNQDERPLDKHITAFIIANLDSKDVLPHLESLRDVNVSYSTLGMLSLLATVQWRCKNKPVPHLSQWLGKHIKGAAEIYRNVDTRKKVLKRLEKLLKQGSLPDIYQEIGDKDRRRADDKAFKVAEDEYVLAMREDNLLVDDYQELHFHGHRIGEQVATVAGIIFSIFGIIGYMLYTLMAAIH